MRQFDAKGRILQRQLADAGVTNTAKARESIQYFKDGCGNDGTIVGLVDVAKYKTWVSDIGVTFEPTPAVPKGCVLKN